MSIYFEKIYTSGPFSNSPTDTDDVGEGQLSNRRRAAARGANADKLATKRERYGHKRHRPTYQAASLAEDLAVVLFPSYLFHPEVRERRSGPWTQA